MKILAIRGDNLASLGRKFEIDLAGGDLGGAGIFAISGPVGAGKTTLLDALCLALFDRTPRLSGARGGVPVIEPGKPEAEWLPSHDPRTLLRRGAAAGRAEVDFVGRDGRRYRATWTVRRARMKADGRLQGQEMALVELDRGLTIAAGSKSEVLLAIRQRLGLDFDQFCRSVLLAQGDFSAFLRASADERANLLESLTGVEVYRELSKAAHARRRERQVAVDTLRAQVAAHAPLDGEERAKVQQAVHGLEVELRTSQLGVQLAQDVVSWYAASAKLQKAEGDAQAKLAKARDALAAAAERRERHQVLTRALPLVARAEVVRERQQAVVAAVLRRVGAEEAVAAARTAHAAKQDELRRRLTAQLPTANGTEPSVLADHDRWQPVLQRWHAARAALQGLRAEPSRLLATVAACDREIAAIAEELQAVQAALAAPEFQDLTSRQRALQVEAAALRARRVALSAWSTAAAEHERCRVACAQLEREGDELTDGFAALVAARASAEAALTEARTRRDHARTRADVVAFREHLVAGEPCPLCGSAEHPSPAVPAPQELQAAGATVAAAEAAHAAAHDAVRVREAQRVANARQTALARAAFARAGAAEVDAQKAFVATCATDALIVYGAAAGAVAAAEERHATAAAAWSASAERAQELAGRRESLRTARDAATARRSAAERQLLDLRTAEALVAACEHDLAPAFVGVDDFALRLAELGPTGIAGLAALAKERDAVGGRIPGLAEAAAQAGASERDLLASFDGARATFEQAAAAANVRPADVAEAGELGSDALAVEARQLRELEDAVGACRAAVQECARLRRDHDAVARPMIEEADAAKALADARAACDELGRRLAAARAELAFDDRVQKARAELAPRLAAAEADYEVWAALDDLIGHSDGKTFAVFAQALTLDLLLVEANRRLQDLAPRYRLQRNGGRDMDFVVLDLDLGGAVRSLQTLSGGETFLVSLALALALATLAAPRTRVETLFLDEGFGTLDAHNLEIALGALESLQATGCQIGIISHVEGIAERIGAVVHVVPEGAGQSRIVVRVG